MTTHGHLIFRRNMETLKSTEPCASLQIPRADSTSVSEDTAEDKKSRSPDGLPKPRRPLSAYNFFFKYCRESILEKSQVRPEGKPRHSHGKIGFADLARTIAGKWKDISPSERAVYDEMALQDKIRYKRMMAQWKAKKELGLELTFHEDATVGGNDDGLLEDDSVKPAAPQNGLPEDHSVMQHQQQHALSLVARRGSFPTEIVTPTRSPNQQLAASSMLSPFDVGAGGIGNNNTHHLHHHLDPNNMAAAAGMHVPHPMQGMPMQGLSVGGSPMPGMPGGPMAGFPMQPAMQQPPPPPQLPPSSNTNNNNETGELSQAAEMYFNERVRQFCVNERRRISLMIRRQRLQRLRQLEEDAITQEMNIMQDFEEPDGQGPPPLPPPPNMPTDYGMQGGGGDADASSRQNANGGQQQRENSTSSNNNNDNNQHPWQQLQQQNADSVVGGTIRDLESEFDNFGNQR